MHCQKLVVGDVVLVNEKCSSGNYKINDKWEVNPYTVLEHMMDTLPNAALNRRFEQSCQSKSIFLITTVFSEIFDQDKWLPPKTKLFVSLEQNKVAFSLLSKSAGVTDDSCKIKILNCDLYMKILEMDSMVDKEIENITFQGNSMLYPLYHMKMEQHRISANMHDLSVTNILIGETE